MKTSELISKLTKDYDCKVDNLTLQFKSEKDMTDAADDIANSKPFLLDFDDLTLQFLSESALKVASNAYQIYQNLDESSINKIARSMQLNESEEIIAMSKGLYNDVNKRTLCAHLGINDLLPDESTNDIDTANAPELAQVANESHIHTVKFSSFDDAEKSANTKGVIFKNAKFAMIGPDDGPKTRYHIADLYASNKTIGVFKFNEDTKLGIVELNNDVSKDSVFDSYVNESSATVELQVSLKYATKANDAFNDATNIKVTQKTSNSWLVDKDDIDDIKDLLKAWSVKEYEFVNESSATVELQVSLKYATKANDAFNDATNIKVTQKTSNSWLVDKDDIDDIKDLLKAWSVKEYEFVNESSQQTKIYETRSAITKILLNSKLNNKELLETLEPLNYELKNNGSLKTWLTIKDSISLNESNAPEVFAKKREIEDKLKNTKLSAQERKDLEDALYQVNSNIGRHNLNESFMKSIIDKKFWVMPYDLIENKKYTWFMGAEPLECVYLGIDIVKGGYKFQLGKQIHRLGSQDVKDYIFALEYMNESNEVAAPYDVALSLNKTIKKGSKCTVNDITSGKEKQAGMTKLEIASDVGKTVLVFDKDDDDISLWLNESAVAYKVPRSAFANPWLTHKIQSASWIRPYEFGNAFNDAIVNAEVACDNCSSDGINTAAEVKAVYVNESNQICFAPAVPLYISESGDITTDAQFKEYAKVVLKEAHGDNYKEDIANKTIEDLLKNYKNNYGAMVGALTSGFGN